MKVPSQTKSPSKVKKRKGEMINDLLAMTMAHIKVKKEPISEEDAPHKTTPKKRIESSRSGSPKKKMSKAHNVNENISGSEPATTKKIKLEKAPEDERRNSFSIRIKKEKGSSNDNNSFMKERDALEKLFSGSATPDKMLNSSREELKNSTSNAKFVPSALSKLKTSNSSKSRTEQKNRKFPQPVQKKVEKSLSDISSSSEGASSSNIRNENSLNLRGKSMDTSESSSSESGNNRRKRLKSEKPPKVVKKLTSGSIGSNLSDFYIDEFMGNHSTMASSVPHSTPLKRDSQRKSSTGKSYVDNKSSKNTSESSGDESESKNVTSLNTPTNAVANHGSKSTSRLADTQVRSSKAQRMKSDPQTRQQKISDLKYDSDESLKSQVANMLFSNTSANNSESEGSSDEPIKNEITERFSVLKKTDKKTSDSDTGSSSEPDRLPKAHRPKRVLPAKSRDTESSSDEEVPLPKPIKHERNERSKASDKKKRFSVPLPIKADRKTSASDSSSEEETSSVTQRANDKALPVVNRDSEATSGSDGESSDPEPKQMLVKYSNLQNKADKRAFGSATRNFEDKSLKLKQHSSDEDVPLPKPIKHERNERSKASDVKKRFSVPLPIKADRKASASDSSSEEETSSVIQRANEKALPVVNRDSDASSGSDGESSDPEPKQMQVKYSNLQNKADKRVFGSATRNFEDKSLKLKQHSSDEDVPLPKPIKHERKERSKASGKKKRISVPLPIKNGRKTPASDSSGEEEATHKVNEMQRQSHSSSSSEAEVPPPKRIKIENSRGQVQVPPPSSLKHEDSSSSDQEHSSRAAANDKLAWKNGSEYSALNWTEKIKQRFPGSEKQSIKIRLPEERSTKYGLLLVPKHLDPRNLLNLKCNLNKNTVVNLNKKEYIFELLPKKPDPVVVNLDKPRLVKLHSVITLQQFVPELKLKELIAPKRENVSLPSEIKVRHPLFGANYKAKLRLDKNVKRKLQEAIDHKRKSEEKEKRRRKSKKKGHAQSVEDTIMDIFNSAASTTGNINDIDLIPSSKSKRSREQSFSGAAVDSPKKKRKGSKETVSRSKEIFATSLSDDSSKSKKKRKSRDSFENSLGNESKRKKHYL